MLADAKQFEQTKRAKDGIFRSICEVKSRKSRAAKLDSVKPIAPELPEPEKPFEVAAPVVLTIETLRASR